MYQPKLSFSPRLRINLLTGSQIRVPEEEVRRLGREYQSVHFPDGGYFGMLTVHHNLHCLVSHSLHGRHEVWPTTHFRPQNSTPEVERLRDGPEAPAQPFLFGPLFSKFDG